MVVPHSARIENPSKLMSRRAVSMMEVWIYEDSCILLLRPLNVNGSYKLEGHESFCYSTDSRITAPSYDTAILGSWIQPVERSPGKVSTALYFSKSDCRYRTLAILSTEANRTDWAFSVMLIRITSLAKCSGAWEWEIWWGLGSKHLSAAGGCWSTWILQPMTSP